MLVLFDIDGTLLLRAFVEHRRALAEAVAEVWGATDPGHPAVPAAGRTDLAIAREICLLGGVVAERFDAGAGEFHTTCAGAYARLCPADLRDRLAPDVDAVLAELATWPDAQLSLVTGNLEPVARLKLARAGLGRWFAPGQGAFGSDAEDRSALPPIARRRAGSNGTAWPRERAVVVGDTPADVACAHADGLRCVAVATGPFRADELRTADAVIAGLRELPAALRALG